MIMTENRFIVMKRTQTLYLLFISGFCSLTLGSSDFHLVKLSKTYKDARTYCREIYTDLVTIQNLADMDDLSTLFSNTSSRAWIGLETGDAWMWHWSWPYSKVDFLNWNTGEPQSKNQDACAAIDQHGKWFESDCGIKRSFVCRGNRVTSAYIFVPETKSWRDAQSHCRNLLSDLVSVHSAEENKAVHNVSMSQKVWIGLFKDPWKWSDGSNSSFRYWKPNQPNYLEGQDCVAAVFKDQGKWNDLKCNGKCHFVCHGARKSIPASTHQTSTQDTLTADQLQTTVTSHPDTPSPEVTPTFHFTSSSSSSSSSHLNATNFTTDQSKATSELTAPNITEPVSSNDWNNATTQMSVTASQVLPTATVNITTDSAFASTAAAGTLSQNSTQFSDLTPTENSQISPPGILILIQENMTWIEAMSYCRKHHIDLVHITTKDIQEKVADKAKNATSSHVWLGLRYTCNSNFWFWTSSTTGCYLNWAPGQGSYRTYDCGVTGAIEATGGQQWVGLPETEKLNFICYACAG